MTINPQKQSSRPTAGRLLLLLLICFAGWAKAASDSVLISQIYGGGGNVGAVYQNDFIELYNRGGTAVDLSSWSLQYSGSTNGNWKKTDLAGVIEPAHYYLVQTTSNITTNGLPLPVPDCIRTNNLNATLGKIVLLNNQTLLPAGTASPVDLPELIDFVGYGAVDAWEGSGPTPSPSATLSIVRGGSGSIDSDDNAADFLTTAPNPRNSSSPPPPVPASTLVGWDVSQQSSFGDSPLAPTVNAEHLSVTSLTRGSGLTTAGTGVLRGWGGTGFDYPSASDAIRSNAFITFSLTANAGYELSCASLSRWDYRRSGTGPTNGLLQYQLGTGPFFDIIPVTYSSAAATGGSLGPIDLSQIPALQHVPANKPVTFRIVNWGAAGSSGTWYLFDIAKTTAPDLELQGTLKPTSALTPLQAWRQQWFGTTNNSGRAADTNVLCGDRLPNLAKYALGLNPLKPATNPVLADTTTGHLRLTVPRNVNATDTTLSVLMATSLAGPWSTNGTVIDQNTPALLQVHDSASVKVATNRFLQLRLRQP